MVSTATSGAMLVIVAVWEWLFSLAPKTEITGTI